MTLETKKVLVVDDDDSIRKTLAVELQARGYGALSAPDGAAALEIVESSPPDVLIVDLAMPVMDGFSLIRAVRRSSTVPIIVLSVRPGESDKIRALDLGADDYLTKPVSFPELMARVRAQLRRSSPDQPVFEFQELRIDLDRRTVRQGERDVHLTPREFAILVFLAQNAGRPIAVSRILQRVWGPDPTVSHDTVRVHVGSLRRKLEPDPSDPRFIVTEPWVGYRLIAEPTGS